MRRMLLVTGVFGVLLHGVAHAATFSIDSRSTFLHTQSDPGAQSPFLLTLAAAGFAPGDLLLLEALGDFAFNETLAETGSGLIGVFSSSSTVLAATNVARIPGAIDAGADIVTPLTFFPQTNRQSTDIPEDFFIGTTLIHVPAGAAFLFVGVSDSHFGDNRDFDGDFGLRVTEVNAVPEPGSLILLGTGAMGLLARAQRRRVTRRTQGAAA